MPRNIGGGMLGSMLSLGAKEMYLGLLTGKQRYSMPRALEAVC